VKNFKNLKKN